MAKFLRFVGVLSCLTAGTLAPGALATTTGENGSHDPSRMIACEGKVYIYSTGGGGKSSPDGLSWKGVATPPWNKSLSNNQGIWAPDGIFLDGKYLLYGSMWNDGKASRIVLLSSPTLNPDSPKYAWKDEGTVVEGPAGVTHSVIDPAPVLDAQGNLYVVWGGGYPFGTDADSIFLTRLDNATGLALTTDPGYKPPASPGYALAKGHKEGPYIHLHDNNYFLFYQTGGCCSGAQSTYTIHVARATNITGPYSGDKTFYASKGSIHGPGHMGIYDACGEQRFTYHYYPDSGSSVIGENQLVWGADGWPTVGAEATSPLKICDVPVGTGGSSGVGGSAMGGAPGASGASGSSGSPSGGSGNGNANGGSAPTSNGGATSAGTSNVSGSVATAGASSVAGSAPSSGSAGQPDDLPDDQAAIGCACSVPGTSQGAGSRAAWLAAGAIALGLRRRRRATEVT